MTVSPVGLSSCRTLVSAQVPGPKFRGPSSGGTGPWEPVTSLTKPDNLMRRTSTKVLVDALSVGTCSLAKPKPRDPPARLLVDVAEHLIELVDGHENRPSFGSF